VHQVRAASLACYLDVSRQVGLDTGAMVREAGLQCSWLADPDMRVSAGSAVELLELSAERSGCESFGLLMAEARAFTSIGPLAVLLERLETVGEVIDALIRYRRHMNDIIDVSMEAIDGTSIIRTELIPEFARTQALDYTLGYCFQVLKSVSGGRWAPSLVHLVRKAPADLSVPRRLFQAPLEFESSFNGFSCPTELLAMKNPMANAEMARQIEGLLQLVPLEDEEAPFSDRTRRLVTLLLPKGNATVEQVASSLGISPRALQRSLEQEGQNFALLLNEARRELAQRYLTSSSRSITAVAELTGYASLSSFSRWFAREFGTSPLSWRAAQRRAGARAAQSVATRGKSLIS